MICQKAIGSFGSLTSSTHDSFSHSWTWRGLQLECDQIGRTDPTPSHSCQAVCKKYGIDLSEEVQPWASVKNSLFWAGVVQYFGCFCAKLPCRLLGWILTRVSVPEWHGLWRQGPSRLCPSTNYCRCQCMIMIVFVAIFWWYQVYTHIPGAYLVRRKRKSAQGQVSSATFAKQSTPKIVVTS